MFRKEIKDNQTERQMDERMDRQTDGRMDGRTQKEGQIRGKRSHEKVRIRAFLIKRNPQKIIRIHCFLFHQLQGRPHTKI